MTESTEPPVMAMHISTHDFGPTDPSRPIYTLTFHRTDDGQIETRELQNGILPSQRIATLAAFVYDAIRRDYEEGIAGLGNALTPQQVAAIRARVKAVYDALLPIGAVAQSVTDEYMRSHP